MKKSHRITENEMSKFVCGADLAYKGEKKYAVDPMGIFDNVESAVKANKSLHPSFGYAIYEVDCDAMAEVTRCFGLNQGKKTTGLPIIRKVCNAYNHPSWDQQAN